MARVEFPPGAVSEEITVSVSVVERHPDLGGFQVLGQVIAIEAWNSSGESVTQFNRPFTIVIEYKPEDVVGMDVNLLTLNYWHETSQQWIPIPTTVDAANHRLIISLDHLTLFALLEDTRSWIYLPQVTK